MKSQELIYGTEVYDESLLWKSMLAGDERAFKSLLNLTYDLLFQYGNKFTTDRELVKDMIQDLFLEIWEKRESINQDIPPKAYLLASLRRKLHRFYKRNKLFYIGSYDALHDQFQIEFGVEQRFIKSEEALFNTEQISQLLNQLPARQKEAIYLKYFQDLDRDQVAEIMNINPQSVSNLLHLAFKQIKMDWKFLLSYLIITDIMA